MHNPFKSDEGKPDQSGGDEQSNDDGSVRKTDDDYKDDAADFGASSDYAQRGRTNQYDGGSPESGSSNFEGGTAGKGNNAGSQEQWRGTATEHAMSEKAAGDEAEAEPSDRDEEAYGDVPSRSADAGQSSHGGLGNEGPPPHDGAQQKASDDTRPKSTDGDASLP